MSTTRRRNGLEGKPVQNPYSYPTRLLAGDIYGNLYVAYADGNVYSFTENEFITSQPDMSKKEKVCTVPVQAEKIAVDYDRPSMRSIKTNCINTHMNK